jgi:diguanylate cyclase (GGDEF)-like protein/PAS domain S-box-containing protein
MDFSSDSEGVGLSSPSETSDSGIKILVVEDQKLTAWHLGSDLKQLGYDVVGTVCTAEAALLAVAASNPDLILMDIRLAGPEDGITAAELITFCFKIPIIFLTAHADDITLRRATASHPYGYLLKPFQIDQLRATIQVAWQRYHQENRVENQRRQIADTLRSLSDAILTTDEQGRVTLLNPDAEILTGWLEQEALGRPIEQVIRLLDVESRAEFPNPLRQAMAAGEKTVLTEICCLLDRRGEAHFVGISVAPIKNDRGQIVGGVMMFQDLAERPQGLEKPRRDVFCDRLTGLPNQAVFFDRLSTHLQEFSDNQQPVVVILIDLDNLQQINDTLGSVVADGLLLEVTQRLRRCFRLPDTISRLGSDRFGILLLAMPESKVVELCRWRLMTEFTQAFFWAGQEIPVQASIGVAILTHPDQQPQDLISKAELGLRQIRALGGENDHIASSPV